MLDELYIPKVCDWGLSHSSLYSGTPSYKAPEQVIKNKGAHIEGKKLDSWNLGIVLYYIIKRELPYSKANHADFTEGKCELVMDECLEEK